MSKNSIPKTSEIYNTVPITFHKKSTPSRRDNSASDVRVLALFQALKECGYTITLRPIKQRKMPCIVPLGGAA